MRLLCVLAAALVIPATAVAKQVDPVTYAISQLHDAAHCDDKASLWRPWCIADGFRDGTAAPLPTRALVGFTIEIGADADVGAALTTKVSLCALATGADHKVNLLQINPTSDAERMMTAKAIAALSPVFKGIATVAPLPADLVGYVTTLHGTYTATAGSNAWTWTGKNEVELAKVGAFWVAVELGPRPPLTRGARHQGFGTVWVSILTDAWK